MLTCYLYKGHTLTCTQKPSVVQIAVQAINITAKLLPDQNNPQKRHDQNEVRLYYFRGTHPIILFFFFSLKVGGKDNSSAEQPILDQHI